MQGKRQVTRSRTVEAPAITVWNLVSDAQRLPEWVTMVQRVTVRTEGPERIGSVRECQVVFAGRSGHIVERCSELSVGAHVGYVVDDDSLGFRHMFDDYGFTIRLDPCGPNQTAIQIETFYTPRTPWFAFMNAIVMRRQIGKAVDGMLDGLRAVVEASASRQLESTRANLVAPGLPPPTPVS